MKLRSLLVATATLCSSLAGEAHAALYTITDLGTFGGTSSFALDVNNKRQVSGNAQTPPDQPSPRLNAFSWTSPGPMTNLGVLSGSNNFSRGYAINDAGVVVGESDNNASRAFVYRNGTMSGLTRLAGDTDSGVAHDINNANTIVGISSNGVVSRPTMWMFDGTTYGPTDLGTIAGTPTSTGRAWAVNQSGVAAGLSTNALGTSQATLWDGGAITNLTSLGDGTRFSQAFGLNDSQLVVGSSSTGQTVGELTGTTSTTSITRAFAWSNGSMAELSPFDLFGPGNTGPTTNYHSVAMDVNNAAIRNGSLVWPQSRRSGATAWRPI